MVKNIHEAWSHAMKVASEARYNAKLITESELLDENCKKAKAEYLECAEEQEQYAAWIDELLDMRAAVRKLGEAATYYKDSIFGDGIRYALKVISEPRKRGMERADKKMIDNLKDAIAHAREVAENWKSQLVNCVSEEGRNSCLDSAAEHELLASWLEELQERIENDRWIPVSERLPDDRKKVRVTAYWHERFQVMDASYYGDGVWWCVPFNNCGKHMRNDLHVIAWKPDDEPYEESEAENE